jgi:hypothetical protein
MSCSFLFPIVAPTLANAAAALFCICMKQEVVQFKEIGGVFQVFIIYKTGALKNALMIDMEF